ncbi:MAG: T9SS type A sorting domain-containing protein [Bacteroidetes bacterium]|nr:T9SS type A sorting domain-containing protein [Bacteroidota bacterium]
MKKLLLFSIAPLFIMGEASAQATPTVTVTNATNCTAPCDGSATTNDVSALGGTYLWTDPQAQTTMTATGLCPGTYSVTITIPIIGSATGTGTVVCVAGVNTIATEENISVFPNPAHNEIYISIETHLQGKVDFTIRSILGTVAYKESIDTNGYLYEWVDISALPVGIYDVEFMSENKIIRKKFIKQ